MAFIHILILVASLIVVLFRKRRRRRLPDGEIPRVFGFFHPFCSAGGGGERVLWHIIQILLKQAHAKPPTIIIYTVDPPSATYKENLLRHVQDHFSIVLDNSESIEFVHLHEYKNLLLPAPRWSMMVESWNTIKLAYQGLQQSSKRHTLPDVWVDTTGCAFTFCVAWYFHVPNIFAYVHYPTISTDMLKVVAQQSRPTTADSETYKGHRLSLLQRTIKCIYYCAFAMMYSLVGGCLCNCVLVNSTWTYNHIRSLWWYAALRHRIRIVFPPCGALLDVETSSVKKKEPERQYILSIGQFRPEKDHPLQIYAIQRLLRQHPELQGKVQLVVIGSCRHVEDDQRLARLREMARECGLDDSAIQFEVNQRYAVVLEWLNKAHVGIHTMWNEHFGIGIVEMMAAGLLVVAHNSGGPKSDIVIPYKGQQTGFLAATVEEYAQALYDAVTMAEVDANKIRKAAKASTSRFTDAVFADFMKKALQEAHLI
jgi:alpha-1,2-mannosyltransferase